MEMKENAYVFVQRFVIACKSLPVFHKQSYLRNDIVAILFFDRSFIWTAYSFRYLLTVPRTSSIHSFRFAGLLLLSLFSLLFLSLFSS